MNPSPLASILIPTYNRERLIAETVNSALAQDRANLEVIVVDNASTDGTWSVLQSIAARDARLRIFRNDRNIGPVRNWLACARHARGEFAKILWSDDLIASSFLSETLPLLQDDVGFVYTAVEIFEDEKVIETAYGRDATGLLPSSEFIENALYGWNVPYSPGCAVLRTADLRKFLMADVPNRVSSDFSMHAIGNDLLLLLLTAHAYARVGFVNTTLSRFRHHAGSISASAQAGKLSLHYGLAKGYFAQSAKLDPKVQARLDAALQLELWRYRHNSYGIRSLQDFYPQPRQSHVDPVFLLKRGLTGTARVLGRKLQRFGGAARPQAASGNKLSA